MENRCGREKGRKREGEERNMRGEVKKKKRRGKGSKRVKDKGWMLLPIRLESKMMHIRFVCQCV